MAALLRGCRKAALAYLRIQEFDMADDTISKIPDSDEACNYYVLFLSGCLQGLDEKGWPAHLLLSYMNGSTHLAACFLVWLIASRALKRLIHASNFQPQMLLWAAKQANEAGLKDLVTEVFEAIIALVGNEGSMVVENVDMLVLIR